jgi:hypothetical protein
MMDGMAGMHGMEQQLSPVLSATRIGRSSSQQHAARDAARSLLLMMQPAISCMIPGCCRPVHPHPDHASHPHPTFLGRDPAQMVS